MARDVLDILRAKRINPLEFDFDNLWIPPMHMYLTQEDIDALHSIATSIRLSSKINQKYEMIDRIMRNRGFKRFAAGTNRVVYSCLEDTRFLVKIAVDKVGLQDNPMEYQNQFLLKPYVTKMFYHSPCGTVGFSERVLPIKNRAEFKEIAGDVFEIIVHKILGKYVVEDIGTKFFMNWGIRLGHHPVLLDSPYVYKLDGKKLYCTKEDPITNSLCNGEIDYDPGFNHLTCTRCGKIYLATDLRDNSIDNKIIIKRGGTQMKVILKHGDEIVSSPIQTDDFITPKKTTQKKGATKLVAKLPQSEPYVAENQTNEEEKTRPRILATFGSSSNDGRNSKRTSSQHKNRATGKTAPKVKTGKKGDDSGLEEYLHPELPNDDKKSEASNNETGVVTNATDKPEIKEDAGETTASTATEAVESKDNTDSNTDVDNKPAESDTSSDSEAGNTDASEEAKPAVRARTTPKRGADGKFISSKKKTTKIPSK